ncbi:unnamed protein product [Linum trigynum]|uniref:Uncharacterized protein n=1 Tax=Linum trigynum TaxID=586398 RepID=A0AAV2GAX9_9ROSI
MDSNVGRRRGGGDLEAQSRGVAGGGRPATEMETGSRFGGDGNGDGRRTQVWRRELISERERFGGGVLLSAGRFGGGQNLGLEEDRRSTDSMTKFGVWWRPH